MVGRVAEVGAISQELNDWVNRYTADDDDPDEATRARYPFRQAQVDVQRKDSMGLFECTVRLRPHAEVDGLSGTIELQTSIAGDS